jgi:phage-related minor tail protein
MKSAASQMKVLSAEYTTAATKAKLFGSETDSLKAKAESLTQKITVQKNIVQLNSEQQEKLTKKLSDQKTKQEELKTKIDAAKEAYEKSTAETGKNSEQSKALKDELDKLEKEFTANETAIGKTETALANQTVKTEKSKTALMNMEAELKNVNDQLKDNKLEKFATACDTAGTKMESFGKKMSVVSAGIAGIGAASIKAFTELDEGYDTIVTKTGATGEALEGLTKSADNVFGTMPEDMSTVGEAIGEVNTRFHTTGTELKKTSKQFIQFATINGTNVTQSVDQVDKIMKAWNVDASQTGNLLGLLTAKAQETGISVDTLEGYVLDNNAQFKEMGLSLPKAINLMAQFDANGVDSTQAMAGLKKALQNATSEGKSMDEALSDTIGSIKNAKTETEAMQIATELFGKKGAAEMTKAIRENRIDLTSLSSSMEEYGSTVEDTYNGTLDPIDNAKVAMNNAKLALSTLASTAQTSAAPMIEKLTGKIQELTQWFTSLSPAQQETVLKVGLVVAAIGPLSIGFGKVAKGISDTVTTGQKFVSGAAKIIAKITAKTAATAAGTAGGTHKYSQNSKGENIYHQNITIRNNEFKNIHDNGVFVLNWKNTKIENNKFTNIGNSSKKSYSSGAHAISGGGIEEINITGNTFTKIKRNPVYFCIQQNVGGGSNYKKVGMKITKEETKAMLDNKVSDCGYDMNSIFHGYDILYFKGSGERSRSNAVGVNINKQIISYGL